MNTYHIHITGQVQGVGFRPFVYKLALGIDLKGWVKNTIDGVHVRFNASQKGAEDFYHQLLERAPALSIITQHSLTTIEPETFQSFEIIHSDHTGKANLLLTPDFAICPDCLAEITKQGDRRFAYPFITCTNCGPRYSIITGLPYDRPLTAMAPFEMCPICKEEYQDPLDRRYYSQTNSCPACAVELKLYQADHFASFKQVPDLTPDDQIRMVIESLIDGKIVAIKGIGGFLILCDASNKKAISILRKRKHRPSKAFALMYPDIDAIRRELVLHADAEKWLIGPVSPIVLLRRQAVNKSNVCFESVAPGLDHIGVMIPYSPLYRELLKLAGRPLIATSGNISNEPIIFKNEEAFNKLSGIVDLLLVNNRDIVIPQDDSVITFSPVKRQQIIYRRSRGLAPGFLDPQIRFSKDTILAVGGELKSSFTFLCNQIAFISQYLGDLADFDSQTTYKKVVQHFFNLFSELPRIILHDSHPGYYSTQLANELSDGKNVDELVPVQHHEAHFAAVLGENHLFDRGEKVLGVIWDGTGYGSDGQIWGGEFFVYNHGVIQRYHHLPYFDFVLGDKMPREPRISALAMCHKHSSSAVHLQKKFNKTEWRVFETLLQGEKHLQTSSIGRLFDAIASLVLDIDICSYEGEAAMFLEVAARMYQDKTGMGQFEPYLSCFSTDSTLELMGLADCIITDMNAGQDRDRIAFRFHCTLVIWIHRVAKACNINHLAFSGGVFQNGLLVDLVIEQLGSEYNLYFHKNLSPNDECISFGQLIHYQYITTGQQPG